MSAFKIDVPNSETYIEPRNLFAEFLETEEEIVEFNGVSICREVILNTLKYDTLPVDAPRGLQGFHNLCKSVWVEPVDIEGDDIEGDELQPDDETADVNENESNDAAAAEDP